MRSNRNVGEGNMYKALEVKVLADEDRKQKEGEGRVIMGLPAEEGQL
jgi:hypothetical protein